MLLQRLVELHDRVESEIAPPYHKEDEIDWIIEITPEGHFKQFIETSGGNGGPMSSYRPDRVRTINVAPYLVVDKPSYVLGLNLGKFDEEYKVTDRHDAYLELITECKEATGEPVLQAVETFLKNDIQKAREDRRVSELEDADMITFRVENQLVHQLESIKQFWIRRERKRHSKDSNIRSECLICGDSKQIAVIHPINHQLGQAGLISAGENAFESYGLSNSEVAPICHQCAISYGQALNYLFDSDEHYIRIGGITFAYWTKEPTDTDLADLLTAPDPQEVEHLLESPPTGREEPGKVKPNEFYALTATANKSRLIIRNWLETTVPRVRRNLAQFFKRQRMVDTSGQLGRPLGIYSLAGSLVREFNDLSPNTVPALFDNALRGSPLPDSLLNLAINQARADTDNRMTQPRAALIKMILNQNPEPNQSEGVKMKEKIDPQSDNPAYLCGRLLGVLEEIQEAAQPGIVTTIVDRYYGTASSAPASVFGHLLRKSQNHLSKLSKDNKGTYYALQKKLEEVLSGIDKFPKTLNYEEQGRFSLGYYHQRAASRAQARKRIGKSESAEAPAE